MHGRILFSMELALLLLVAGCGSLPPVASGGVTPTSICQVVASLQGNGTAAGLLGQLAPTSALGVVWADLQSGCAAGQPAAGVSPSWTAQDAGMFKALLPQVLPALLPLIVGAL